MSNQPRSNCVDAKTNAIALAFCVCALLCIYAPLYLIVHCTCVCGSFIFIRLLSSHTWCHALIHPSIQSIVFSFASRLIGSISSECIANTVSSHCGWHALFWLTLLSFDCNFIQKIRMSILAQRLSVCVSVVQFMCIIYIFGFLITCRGNLLLVQTFVHFLCFRLRFGFHILFSAFTSFYLLFKFSTLNLKK